MAKKISDIRRQEIIEALQKSILDQGMTMPSYKQIAESGDMSRQLIRHYFPDEDDMMLSLCQLLEQAYRDCFVTTAIAAGDGDRLTFFIDFFFNLLSERGIPKPQDDKIYDALFSYAGTSEPVREKLHAGYQLVQMTFAHEIQVTHPNLSQTTCKEIAYLIIAIMYGHWKMVRTIGFSETYSLVARNSILKIIDSYVDEGAQTPD